MQSLTDCPGRRLERAEDAEHLAKEMDDPEAKRDTRDIAEACRRIGAMARLRANDQ